MVFMLVVLACCGWNSMLFSVGYMAIILCISVLLYLWFSPYLGYECIPSCHQTSQPENPFKNFKNLVLFDWIFEIVLACFFVVWKQFLAQTWTKWPNFLHWWNNNALMEHSGQPLTLLKRQWWCVLRKPKWIWTNKLL